MNAHRELQPCGTPAAYRRHLRRGEKACPACKAAHAAAIAARPKTASVRELRPCGTEAAYRRHLRRGERPCADCCSAHAEVCADYVQRRRVA